jgi:hyperosmotically inducible protein
MRSTFVNATIGLAALAFAAAPAYAAETSATNTMEKKADEAGNKVKKTAEDAKTGMSDSWVTAKTKIALFADEHVKGRQVSVETKNGVVMLRGKVDSADAKSAAADIAKGLEGVKDVKNELQVVAPSERAQVTANDKEITKSVEQRLKQDPQLKKIDARVDSGVVILTGEVPSIGASAKASEVARGVPGVRFVKNDLTYGSRSSLK